MRQPELPADQDQVGGADWDHFAVPAEKTDRQGMCRLEPQALVVEMGRRQPAEQAGRTMTGATSRRGEDQPWCADRNRGAVSTEKTDRQTGWQDDDCYHLPQRRAPAMGC
ncbi:unnamed protein product, partial [Brenthis ino]